MNKPLISEAEAAQRINCHLLEHSTHVEVYTDVLDILINMTEDGCYTMQDLYKDLTELADKLRITVGQTILIRNPEGTED